MVGQHRNDAGEVCHDYSMTTIGCRVSENRIKNTVVIYSKQKTVEFLDLLDRRMEGTGLFYIRFMSKVRPTVALVIMSDGG